MTEAPRDAVRVFYGELGGDLLFVRQTTAERFSSLEEARSADSWSAYISKLRAVGLEDEAEDAKEMWESFERSDESFRDYRDSQYGEGDWPGADLESAHTEWMPSAVLKLGDEGSSMVSGVGVVFAAEDESRIVEALRSNGFIVERNDDLMLSLLPPQ